MGHVHHLCDDGQAGLCPGGLQKLQTVLAQPLEGVGGGAGLESAAPEHGCTAGLHRLGNGHHLLLRLHRAGPGHNGQISSANLGVPHLDHGVLGVELPIGVFVGLLDPLHILHNVQGGDQVNVQLGGVAHQAQDGVGLADTGADGDSFLLEPGDQSLQLVRIVVALENDNHNKFLLKS